jgi:hypothetical protein
LYIFEPCDAAGYPGVGGFEAILLNRPGQQGHS